MPDTEVSGPGASTGPAGAPGALGDLLRHLHCQRGEAAWAEDGEVVRRLDAALTRDLGRAGLRVDDIAAALPVPEHTDRDQADDQVLDDLARYTRRVRAAGHRDRAAELTAWHGELVAALAALRHDPDGPPSRPGRPGRPR